MLNPDNDFWQAKRFSSVARIAHHRQQPRNIVVQMDEELFKTEIVRRAVQDAAFRAALLADPKGTIERALGQPLPDSFAVEVIQESARQHTVRYFDGINSVLEIRLKGSARLAGAFCH